MVNKPSKLPTQFKFHTASDRLRSLPQGHYVLYLFQMVQEAHSWRVTNYNIFQYKLIMYIHFKSKNPMQYAGTVKRHNVCNRRVATDTGFKQTERTIFFPCYFNGIKIVTAFKYIFEETMPKLSVNFRNHTSQNSNKNQYSGTSVNLVLLHHNTVTNVDQICC